MECVYKLTDADGGLCTDGVIHAYRSPLLALLLNLPTNPEGQQ